MKKLLVVGIMVGAMSLTVMAGTSLAQSADGTRTIGIATYSMTNTAIYPLLQSMIDGVEAHGDKYVLVSAKGSDDIPGVVQSVEELVMRDDIDGILVDNIDDSALTDVVAKANERGIPMVFNDIPFSDPDKIVANVVNDNYGGGKLTAEACVKDLDGKGNIILFGHNANAVMKARTQAVHDVLDQNPDINLLYEGLVDLDVNKAASNTEDLLQTYDDIDAIIALVDNQTIGEVAAIKQQGREGIKLYSLDGSADICPLIKNGDVVMSSAQVFTQMGDLSVQALYDYFDGKEVEKEILVPAEAIDQSNVDEWIDFFDNTEYSFVK